MLLLIYFLILVELVSGKFRCHNRCSGHGDCSDYTNICSCFDGYTGVDCSGKLCPYDLAWADKAYDDDTAHNIAECSNAGVCDRRTGRCRCFSGFRGEACERTICGGTPECNGHGQCLTMGQAYEKFTAAGLAVSSYTPWESNHTTICSCENGYTGVACEIKMCPKGDDPFTAFTGYRSIILTVSNKYGLSNLGGKFRFSFNTESFYFPPTAEAFTERVCRTSLESLDNVQSANCTIIESVPQRTSYRIEFKSFPQYPVENNIFTLNDGNPMLSSFACGTNLINGTSLYLKSLDCTITDVDTDKVYPEYAMCSNRGSCDTTTGVCRCAPDLVNSNCADFKPAITINRRAVDNDVLTIEATNPQFQSASITLESLFAADATFNQITADDIDSNIWRLDGYGHVRMNYGGLSIGTNGTGNTGGATIASGGLTVTRGVTIFSEGLVSDGLLTIDSLGLKVFDNGFSVVGGLDLKNSPFRVTGGATVANGIYINGTEFSVNAGGGTVALGGFMVTGGVTVAGGGVYVDKRGVTIRTDGFVVDGGVRLNGIRSHITSPEQVQIQSGGLIISGGLTLVDQGLNAISATGLTIAADGLISPIPITMQDGGLVITDGLSVSSNGIQVTGGVTLNNLGLRIPTGLDITGGATIYNNGLRITGGVTVSSVGLWISGGLILPSGSLTVNPSTAVNVYADGISVTGGLSVINTGIHITNGMTINTLGINVVTGGVTIADDGLSITGGLTVQTAGITVTGGLTLQNLGFSVDDTLEIFTTGLDVVTDGLTVFTDGVRVTGAVSVYDAGVTVTGGVTVFGEGVYSTLGVQLPSNGISITGGLSVLSGGVKVTSGLTILAGGGLLVSDQLRVQNDGITIVGGLSVETDGVDIANGLTIGNNGLTLTGGLTIFDSGIDLTSGLTVNTGSMQVNGGLTISNVGLYVNDNVVSSTHVTLTGGATIYDSGIRIGQYLTVNSGGIDVTGGLTVIGVGGLYTDEMKVNNVGLFVTTSGTTIHNQGILIITGGLSVPNSGMRLTGGLSVQSDGLNTVSLLVRNNGATITGGLSVINQGLRVGQLTIDEDGMTSVGNALVSTDGVETDSKLEIPAGVDVTGGITIRQEGMTVTGGLSIPRDGLVVTGGLTIHDQWLKVSGGVSILDAGFFVTGGLTTPQLLVVSSSAASTVKKDGVQIYGGDAVEIQSDGVAIQDDLRVYGSTNLENQNSGSVFSDGRLKVEIQTVDAPLEKVAGIRGVYFNWKEDLEKVHASKKRAENTLSRGLRRRVPAYAVDENDKQSEILSMEKTEKEFENLFTAENPPKNDIQRQVGFIAQEVQRVFPEAAQLMQGSGNKSKQIKRSLQRMQKGIVDESDIQREEFDSYHYNSSEDDLIGVKYSDMVALIIESIRELDNRTKSIAYAEMSESTESFRSQNSTESLASIQSSADIPTCYCATAIVNEVNSLLRKLEKLEEDEKELNSLFVAVQHSRKL